MASEYIALIGALSSSIIAAIVAFLISTSKSKADRASFESQLKVQTERHTRDILKERAERKIEIAYKYAELYQKDSDAAEIFLAEISKETAVGFLYFEDSDRKLKIWVRNDSNLLVGRSSDCDVVFSDNDKTVSREHCVIHTEDNTPYIIPLNPTNHVSVNGRKIDKTTKIVDRDIIKTGQQEFLYFSL